ncbi:hypothetical protein [Xanthobacter aminoxidans]|uniref:hypothetical protein n=1 Tax=Xanthobacter aminoxidans TaxID=186280 RepID=UPI002022D967|nr:hypothetical protein [Xanthobacter aminoxidans]
MKTLVLVDGDILAYTAGAAVERETRWDDDTFTLAADLDEAKDAFVTMLTKAKKEAEAADAAPVICFTPSGPTFRHALWPTYKEGRKRKPLVHKALVEWAKTELNYPSVEKPGLEADDCLGILATHPANAAFRRVIVSGDKDLAQIPCEILDFKRGTLTTITEEEGEQLFLLQALTGDPTDNYPGCPGIGAKRAPGIAAGGWAAIVAAYAKAGLTEADALIQARLARILRYADYDHQRKEPLLWEPR